MELGWKCLIELDSVSFWFSKALGVFHFLLCSFPVKIFGFISKLVFCGYGIISVLSKQTQGHDIKSKKQNRFQDN